MSEPKLNIKEEESSAKKTRSPRKNPRWSSRCPKRKKLKTDADKAAEKPSICVLAKPNSPRMKHPA